MNKWILSLSPLPLLGLGLMTIGGNINHKQMTTKAQFIKSNTLFNKNRYHEMNYDTYLNDFNNDNSKSLTSNHTAHQLGHGYDRADDTEGLPVFNNNVKVRMYLQTSDLSIKVNNDPKSLYKDLGLDYNMRFANEDSIGSDYLNTIGNNSSKQLNFVFHVSYLVDEELVFPNKDMYTSMALAATYNKAMFFSNYKDKYIAHLMSARSIFFNLEMTSSDIHNYQEIAKKVQSSQNFSDIAKSINYAKSENNNTFNTDIVGSSTYPFNGDSTDDVLPHNLSQVLQNGNATQVKDVFAKLKSNSFNFLTDFAKDSQGLPVEPLNWVAQGISKNDLGDYSNLAGLFKPGTLITNPHEKFIKDFPKLNKYYDEKTNIKQDINNIKHYTDRHPSSNSILIMDAVADMNNTYSEMSWLFMPGNSDFNNMLITYNDSAFLRDLKNTEQLLNIDGNFTIIKKIDFMLHFKFHIESQTLAPNGNNFNFTKNLNHFNNFNFFRNGNFKTQYKTLNSNINLDISTITFNKGLINFKTLSYQNIANQKLANNFSMTANSINMSWIKISGTYRSSVIYFNQFNTKSGYMPLNISAKGYFQVNAYSSTNPDVLFYEVI